MKVSEVAAAAGVSPHTVRFYARSGLLAPQRNPLNGYAEFSEADAQRLRFIRKAQRVGFTLAEVRTLLAMARRQQSPCPLVRSLVSQRLPQVVAAARELEATAERMQRALARWRRMPDAVPTGSQVCRLIESLAEP